MTPTELRDLLLEIIAGTVGGTRASWSKQIGVLEKRPFVENIHSNWRLTPLAVGEDLHAIEEAVKLVRAEHPYVE